MRYFEKKHYDIVARCIREQREAISNIDEAAAPMARLTTWEIAGRLATAFALDSSKFDRKRFMQACGVEQ